MKKSFTLLELVFVVVVIGVLSAIIIPSTRSDNLREAAIQVVSHIRYTQHLAMIDDKLDTSDSNWYKNRWQIQFSNTVGSGNSWSYMIYSDSLGNSTGTPDVNEHAKNPLNPSKYLTGGYSAGNIAYNDPQKRDTKELNIGKKYEIVDVDFSAGCEVASTRQRIFFDNLGRPFYGGPHLQIKPYHNETNVKKLSSNCNIALCTHSPCSSALNSEKLTIVIEPETGYTYISG